jgi:hypothetical protein
MDRQTDRETPGDTLETHTLINKAAVRRVYILVSPLALGIVHTSVVSESVLYKCLPTQGTGLQLSTGYARNAANRQHKA